MSAGLELAEQKDTRRQLAAVVFMDMVGYSALMQRDEAAAQGAVEQLWALARPCIASQNGEEIRRFGDGLLLVFPGAVAAANCCLEVLTALAAHNDNTDGELRLGLRAGLHLGDIGRQADEIYGDGVNIAARLVNLAPPGAIALSPHVRDQLANTLDAPLKSLGQRRLKNISEPMEVFCLPGPDCSSEALDAAAATGEAAQWRWRFGLASFDQGKQELWVNGQAAQLDPRAAAVLQGLLKHAGEIVSRAELCEAAGDISDGALTGAIERLRKALRDSDQVQIKTHPRQGYRLTPEVRVEAAPGARLSQFDFRAGDRPPLRPLWSLQRKLGQGGQGETWLARHDKTGEERVYKFALDTVGQDSLKREITLSRVLHSIDDHGHFIRVLDWNLERPPYFIESQYGGGADLATWAEQQGGPGALPIASRLDLIIQIAEALAAAHSLGVLHKDLKPANVLVDEPAGQPPRIRLADFGSGGVLDPERLDAAGITLQGFTSTLPLEGESTAATPAYLAPELLAGQPATIKADIYALGVMLYQILIGDFRRVLSTGWEQDIDDELLREDIAASTQGQPAQRLGDATELARRLGALQERRAVRTQERMAQQQLRRAEREARQERLRAARARIMWRWSTALTVTLMLGMGLALYQQQRARAAETAAQAAAQEAQAVAEFLSQDLFSTVSEKPLGELTVEELLNAAATKLNRRQDQLPQVSAKLHAALGGAFWSMERLPAAETHLRQALDHFALAGSLGSPGSLQIAAKLLLLDSGQPTSIADKLPRYTAILDTGVLALGERHPDVLALRQALAFTRYVGGDWRGSARDYETLLASAPEQLNQMSSGFGTAQAHYGHVLVQLGRFDDARRVLEQAAADAQAAPMDRVAAEYFLAYALLEQERFGPAGQALERAARRMDRWAVPQISIVRLSLELMRGRIQLRQGQAHAALDTLQPAVQNMAALHNPKGNDFSGEHRAWLARAWLAAGEAARAAEEMGKAIRIHDTVFGAAHPLSQQMRIDLADMQLARGDEAAARALLAELDPAVFERLGTTHPLECRRQQLIGRLAARQGQTALARKHLTQAWQISVQQRGPAHAHSRALEAELQQLSPP